METYGLNPKQIAFADEYIISGNATKSMIKAGYSEKYAGTNSQKLLNNTNVKKYISDMMEKIQSERIMSAEEVLERLTSIGRREPRKGIYNQKTVYDGNEEKATTIEKEYEIVPTTEEETRALELLGKRYALFTEKVDLQSGDIVVKVGEWDAKDEED